MIPETSPKHYLSGMAALNIPSSKGTGDWHLIETFFRPHRQRSRSFIAGTGCETDTMSFLADTGIVECSDILDKWRIPHPPGPVYAANHARAIADMVLVSVLSGSAADFIELDDWMPSDDDKQAVFDLLDRSIIHLTGEQQRKVIAWKKANLN